MLAAALCTGAAAGTTAAETERRVLQQACSGAAASAVATAAREATEAARNQAAQDAAGAALVTSGRQELNADAVVECQLFVGLSLTDEGTEGGAMKVSGADVDVVGCAFIRNKAVHEYRQTSDGMRMSGGYGGAIFVHQESALRVFESAFVGNEADRGGGAIYIAGGFEYGDHAKALDVLSSWFVTNAMTASGDGGHAIYARDPVRMYVYDTEWEPFVDGTVSVNRLGDCEVYPCDLGFGCTYQEYSLSCEPCPAGTVSSDGITCLPCPAGKGPTENRTFCELCEGATYSITGICQDCDAKRVVSNDRTRCEACAPGQQASTDFTRCVCDSTTYNSTKFQISCHETNALAPIPIEHGEVCSLCGPCVDCTTDTPTVSERYVRINLPPQRDEAGERVAYDLFRCDSVSGCFGVTSAAHASSDSFESGCLPNYEGYFCKSCGDKFEMARLHDGSFGCTECAPSNFVAMGILALVAAFSVAIVWGNRAKLTASLLNTHGGAEELHQKVTMVQACTRSVWQPVRILITYGQVTSQIGSVLNAQFPEMFTDLLEMLKNAVSIVDIFAGAECVGLDGFHLSWLMHVLVVPGAMLVCAFAVYAVQRSSRASAKANLVGNAFFVVFFAYPRICTAAFSTFICRVVRLEPKVSVLDADDRVLCQDSVHTAFQVLSGLVIFVVALGVPVGAILLLRRERQRQQRENPVEESLKLRVAGVFRITPEEAEEAVKDIRLGSKYSFLVGTFKGRYYMWESVDMVRKLLLVGLLVWFDRGSVAQVTIALVISFAFLAAHMYFWPYKAHLDNMFRMATEFQVFMSIATALVLRTDLDSPFAAELARSPDSPVVLERFSSDMATRRNFIDALLLVSFLFLVLGGLGMTVLAKFRVVLLALNTTHGEKIDLQDKATLMRAAYNRLSLGLATETENKELREYMDELNVDDHVRAGKRLWRTKKMVSHFSGAEMRAAMEELSATLPKSDCLGWHFTDLDACQLILNHSKGIRASSVGQLGGGISVCLASLTDLGWDKHGGTPFAKKVGEELWGSKWHEVMPDPKPPDAHQDWGKYFNKLECVFVLRIPSEENRDASRIVPGRPNVYIIPRSNCEPGYGKDQASYYSNLNIVQCLVLKTPAGPQTIEELAAREDAVRVQCSSARDSNGGMIDVALEEVAISSAIDDELLPNPATPWMPSVVKTTAMIGKPPKPSSKAETLLQQHKKIEAENLDKQLWPEDVGRFKPAEMAAALLAVEQTLLQPYTLGFFYTSAHNAARMCKDGKGIRTKESGIEISLRSPIDLGWEKYGGGQFNETAGSWLWGSGWRTDHGDQIEAVLVLGVPTQQIGQQDITAGKVKIAEQWLAFADAHKDPSEQAGPLANSDDASDEPHHYWYSNAHIHKSYVLQASTYSGGEGGSKKDVAPVMSKRRPPSLEALQAVYHTHSNGTPSQVGPRATETKNPVAFESSDVESPSDASLRRPPPALPPAAAPRPAPRPGSNVDAPQKRALAPRPLPAIT
jgi:hypothetical protein